MCWVAAIPFIAMGASALMSANQSRQQGAAAASAALQQQGFANQAANDSLKRGSFEADQQRMTTRSVIGSQRASAAANGVDVNSGSAATLQDDAAALGEQDALTISNNAAREAWGYRTQGLSYATQAKNAQATARNNATGSLLSGAANIAGAYSANSSLRT